MGVPSFQQLMLPALQAIGQRHDEISISGLEDGVSRALKISTEERQLRLPSGNQTLFANRLNWARSYLSKAGLIELPRRGYCRATDRGRELLAEGVSEIDLACWSAILNSSPGDPKPRLARRRSKLNRGTTRRSRSLRISSSSTPSSRATLSGACIRSVRAFSNVSSSTFWCAWVM